jgi:hypothetical protein
MTFEVWGGIGVGVVAALGVASMLLPVVSRKTRNEWLSFSLQKKAWVLACAVSILIYLGLFFRLPHEAGYLIPLVPFVIGLFELLLPRPVTVAAWLLLLASPFALDVTISHKLNCERYGAKLSDTPTRYLCLVSQGPVLSYHYARARFTEENERAVKKIARISAKHAGKVVVVAGVRSVMLQVKWRAALGKNVKIVYLIDKKQLNEYKKAGVKLLVLADAARYNRSVHRVNLIANGATRITF